MALAPSHLIVTIVLRRTLYNAFSDFNIGLGGNDVNSAEESAEERYQDQYSFADFTLNPVAGHLWRAGERVELRSKSFEVLAYIVERHGRVVTREELMHAVWPNLSVTDESVTRCIADIRKALADDSQRLIRTVPRRGYLFAVPVTTPVLAFPRATEPQPLEQAFSPPPHPPRRPGYPMRVCFAIAGLALFGFIGWRGSRRQEEVLPLRAAPFITLPGLARYPSFAPDGNYVLFTWNGPKKDNSDIYLQQIGSGSPLRLTVDPRNDYNPVWSPDGRWVAFLRRHTEDSSINEVRLIPPLGGPERKLAEIRVPDTYFLLPPYLSWCPDSSCVVVTDSPAAGQAAALFVISLDTGNKRQLTHPEFAAAADTSPAVSPDAKWLVFRRQTNGSRIGELYRLQVNKTLASTGDPQRLTPAAMDGGYPTWRPDGEGVVFSTEASEARGSLWVLAFSGRDSGKPARLPFAGEDGLMPAISNARPGQPSRLVYVRSFQDSNIWRITTTTEGAEASAPSVIAIASSRRDCVPQFSPDGHRVAFASDRSGSWEIWLSDPDGSNAVQVTFVGSAGAPAWSPDGDQISFQAAPDGHSDVYVIAAAGGKPRNLTFHPANDTRPSFSRDGKWIYFTSNRVGGRQLWKMPASGGAAIQLTSQGAFAAFESPDGRYLYYNRTMDTPSPLWRVPVSGGTPLKILEGVVLGAFAVTERGIYFIDRPAGNSGLLYIDRPVGQTRLRYFDLTSGKHTTVAQELGDVYLGLAASKDGRTILYSRVDSSLDDLMLVENFR